MDDSKQLPNSANLAFVEALYADYLNDPQSVPAEWQQVFQGWARGDAFARTPRLAPSFQPQRYKLPEHREPRAEQRAPGTAAQQPASASEVASLQHRVDMLVRSYRVRGHLIADLDPLGQPRPHHVELSPEYYGLDGHMSEVFSADRVPGVSDALPLRELLAHMRRTYCGKVAVQFMHIDDPDAKDWLIQRMESSENRTELTHDTKHRILRRLTEAVLFEQYVQKKYLGAKSFSLQGAESLLPLLDLAFDHAAEQGLREVVLGMAHRGRLNVLTNIIGKGARRVFYEFEDTNPMEKLGRGDVKYHLGYSSDWTTATGKSVHLSLCFNPSHLEFVNPVVMGRARAKQDRVGDSTGETVMGILIHGDASFAGEGVVQETLNMSELDGYTTGGILHVIVNNQIGFTTSPNQGRSTVYPSDVAKMLQSPIFHVNGDDPEAVAHVVQMALDFRNRFRRDVVIDLVSYRRLGHNEGDEPSFTQPLLYNYIEQHPSVRVIYRDKLLQEGTLGSEQADALESEYQNYLDSELSAAREQGKQAANDYLGGIWRGYQGGPEQHVADVSTGVPVARLAELIEAQTKFPDGFNPHKKLQRGLRQRLKMAQGGQPLDWATAEAAAFASLAVNGVRIRVSGQDSARGTFSQRHGVFADVEDGHQYVPLQHLSETQAPVELINSPLNEAGVLGFEYGYSLDCPDGLVVWEAQFGDFVNAAQVIIDQFLTSAEDKWRRLSGLVLLLPHGFEGQGPEHSSARLERFLHLGSEDNIQVVYPSTPAQYFHVLRRQVLRPWRKPLVVMTPKSLLRHPECTSNLDELAEGQFDRVIADSQVDPKRVKRILLCSGKVFYDLDARRRELERDDIAIIRMEQLYPIPYTQLREALSAYADGTPVVHVQEEPENMGSWYFLRAIFGESMFGRMPFSAVHRQASASPASGSANAHKIEQDQLITEALGDGSEKMASPTPPTYVEVRQSQ